MTVDDAQDARLDRIDARLRAVEELAVELRVLSKMAKPVLLLLATSLGIDVLPLLGEAI
jgi:hypothetical protein